MGIRLNDYRAGTKTPAQSKKENIYNKNLDYGVFFPNAPSGKSKTVVEFNGKKISIEMNDGYHLVTGESDQEKFSLYRYLISQGFESRNNKKAGEPEEKIKEEKKIAYIYLAGHPDNSNNRKIQGEFSVKVKNKNHKLTLKNGNVETEDVDIFNTLLKKHNFYDAGRREKKE
jgi:hypothetical protein